MKDVVLVVPILIAGATMLAATQSRPWQATPGYHTPELAFLAFLFGLLFAWHRGKQSAVERMKAMDLGWNLAADSPASSPRRSVVGFVMLMPASLIGVAGLASSNQPNFSFPIWSAASLLGVTSLICGTILLLNQPASLSPLEPSRRRGVTSKPTVDPDEFDVVSQRGSNGHPSEARY
ncbi:hypothetical protein SAMN05444166_5899 [Singulisphaera sp. GP187]|uniref:hypothetical protein n=1 Tax=Singulisphaera sp. GP187 TaxID=1882752 RepID=UPI000926A217|nr:hypothetical protein [Singulisphaera sp. GP187]SIO59026.1 hypothetical protein SAMN05444166_5899 [Singulisphaera sp. GP187]